MIHICSSLFLERFAYSRFPILLLSFSTYSKTSPSPSTYTFPINRKVEKKAANED